MAWPSGSKAPTTNVDSGTDSITSARADIKQNIDNVNDIIDHLNITSPTDGDLLKYSSSSGKWEQVASTSVSGIRSIFFDLHPTHYRFRDPGYSRKIDTWYDLGDIGIVGELDSAGDTYDSAGNLTDDIYTFNIPAGTYTWHVMPGYDVGTNAGTTVDIRNLTAGETITTFNSFHMGGTDYRLYVPPVPFTLTGSTDIEFKTSSSTSLDDLNFVELRKHS
tara:strand:+ start:175 stop:834 length:660 start_codon:yes stop_codon:yes gene_type:complete